MAELAMRRMTPAEFYRWPGEEGVRYELVDGFPVEAMAGASQRHDRIVVNALATLAGKLRGSPCRPSTADIAIAALNGNIRRPDVSVDCGDMRDTAYEASTPRLVIEVLSTSTRAIDLVRKLEEYRSLPSLTHILLVEPDVPRVLGWHRLPGASWEHIVSEGLDGVIPLDAIGTQLAMAELYDGVTFADPLAG